MTQVPQRPAGSSWQERSGAAPSHAYLPEGDAGNVEQVVILPPKPGVQLLADNEDNVCRDDVRALQEGKRGAQSISTTDLDCLQGK